MTKDWPSQDYDLQEARFIVAKYLQDHAGETLRFLDVTINHQTQKIKLRAPEWIVNILRYFDEKYGVKAGREVSKKVITRFLLQGETIH